MSISEEPPLCDSLSGTDSLRKANRNDQTTNEKNRQSSKSLLRNRSPTFFFLYKDAKYSVEQLAMYGCHSQPSTFLLQVTLGSARSPGGSRLLILFQKHVK
ncbi:hypothetical protein Tcan_00143 [Toxocara canis]|uniref:Uncharacterized protein n=1 Tax=Toxocara canis TaxID=6265 RepID=A0A0B2W1S8_TOXCA|nr:hypothetical protein Tcan_00143 [Toxocara canis]